MFSRNALIRFTEGEFNERLGIGPTNEAGSKDLLVSTEAE